ncbi:hypothetical protein OHA10_36345 [Kribbella sp. NBC_00662]|uniref:hypothetical protein n=1 Tax=Kribbella sp. NBC_00662 TaxID=2975969 RepID=UPI00325138B7
MRTTWWKIEAFFAGLFAVGALVTAVAPQWIEAFGLEPDGGSGSAEWGIVVVLGVVALAVGLVARRHFVAARSLAPEKGAGS